jgi:predicted nucleic acid-binding protein
VSYLLDTNVISETVRAKPNKLVMQWFEQAPDDALHISVLSLGEIRKGVELKAAGHQREALRLWLEHKLPYWFGPRLLPVCADVADKWGRLLGRQRRSLPAIDNLLAATALHHGLSLPAM